VKSCKFSKKTYTQTKQTLLLFNKIYIMDLLIGLCIGIGGFLFLVIIHELGHFFAAKKT